MPKTKRAPVVDLMSALQQSLKAKALGQKNLLRSVPKGLEKEKEIAEGQLGKFCQGKSSL